MSTDGQGTKCRRNIAENFNHLSRVHERYRQTDGRAIAYSEREREFTFAKNELYHSLLLKVMMLHKYSDGRARAPATLVVKTTFLSEQ